MRIALWYDAVVQETDILVNGVPVSKNDIYGFLYPVRNYPIQSWLYPNGSWKGLEYQISDLARDEEVELVFYGRRHEYDALEACLSKSEKKITSSFVEWDVSGRYDELFTSLLSTLKENDLTMREILLLADKSPTYDIDFNLSDDENDWGYHIYNDEDMEKADDAKEMRCCFIHNSFFTSYEKLHELLSLTRSLRVPTEAIYCCFDSEKAMEDYKYYADSYKRMSFTFCLEDSDYYKDATMKYGLPTIVRNKIKKCGELSVILSSAYLSIKEETQEEFRRLKKSIVSLSDEEKQYYKYIKLLRDNGDKFRYGMELISKYIDILLSESKENKEETLHSECIDKLDENIELYLNAKSYNVVEYYEE